MFLWNKGRKKVKPSMREWKEPCSVGENLPDKNRGEWLLMQSIDVVMFSGKHSLYFSC